MILVAISASGIEVTKTTYTKCSAPFGLLQVKLLNDFNGGPYKPPVASICYKSRGLAAAPGPAAQGESERSNTSREQQIDFKVDDARR